MPTWGEILEELNRSRTEGGPLPFDDIRRKYLGLLFGKTGRNTILYASAWCQKIDAAPAVLSIQEEDIQGFMEVVHGLEGPSLDLILHSPGGSPETTEAIVSYLRSHFSDIRVIIPQSAMSAATMLACAADRIVMGSHSFIGPIDPQFVLPTPLGVQSIPAAAIKDQFDLAVKECVDTKKLPAWMPMLGQYGPALYKQCEIAIGLSRELVSKWLESYMFKGRKDASEAALIVADGLSNHSILKSHARHLSREKAESLGLIVESLEADPQLQDLVLSVFHSVSHTFQGTPAVKLIENHLGRAFVKLEQRFIPVQLPGPQPPTQGDE